MTKGNKSQDSVDVKGNEAVKGEKSSSKAKADKRKDERRRNERRNDQRRGDQRREVDSAKLKKENDKLEEKLSEKNLNIDKIKGELDSLKDVMLRRQADFENYKKRMAKQFDDQKKFAVKDLANDIISINDDLLRAIEASKNVTEGESLDDAHKSFVDGVSMISKRIEESLGNHGIVEIEAENAEFDPNFHEAVEFELSSDVKMDTVTKVHQKGFKLDDIVIRSAKVKVTKFVKEEVQQESEKPAE